MQVTLKHLNPADEECFIKENQYAFNYGAKQYFSNSEMEEQYEEAGEIISSDTIYHSIHYDNAITYRIYCNGEPIGGIILNIQENRGDLEIFFVNPKCHSKGIGQAAWKEVERLHPNVKIWETVTPCFEKRNIHFYVNKLKFKIVEYYNEHNKNPHFEEDTGEMYRFEKIIK